VERGDVEEALRQLRGTGVGLMAHAELPGPIDAAAALAASATPPEDPRAYATYLRSRPPAAEDQAVALLFQLCKASGAPGSRTPVHVVHLSSAGALETLRRARDEGVPLVAETTPHYLRFTAEEIPDGATFFKCAPPIRERGNRELLWEGLREGLIHMVVSDHSPCIPSLKKPETGDFMAAWGGIAGLQFGFSAVWTEARERGFSLADVVRWMSAAPAAHAGLTGQKGAIAPGADADLVAFLPDASFVVEAPRIFHKNKPTPYAGQTLRGVVASTWVRGEKVWDGEAFAAPSGRWLKRERA
jgi:allantoinase